MTKVIYYRVVSTGWLQPDLLDTDLINSFNKNIFLFQIEKKASFQKAINGKKSSMQVNLYQELLFLHQLHEVSSYLSEPQLNDQPWGF